MNFWSPDRESESGLSVFWIRLSRLGANYRLLTFPAFSLWSCAWLPFSRIHSFFVDGLQMAVDLLVWCLVSATNHFRLRGFARHRADFDRPV